MTYYEYPYGRPESLTGESLIATYLAFAPEVSSVFDKVGAFAVGQTVGTWLPVPGISSHMVEHYQGRVLAIYDANPAVTTEKAYIIRIAFPTANFGGSFAMLLTALVGNDVSTALSTKLIDLEWTGGALEAYRGPGRGLDYLRELTGAYHRPLVLNMIKPCAGFSPTEGAELFRQVALGGVDLIKDDELLGSPGYNPVAKRAEAYQRVAAEVFTQTGKPVLYLPNITDKNSQIRNNIRAMIDLGIKACLFNYIFAGLDTLRELCDEFGERIFIIGHYAGFSVMNSPNGGIANQVMLGLLPRLAGVHGVMTMCPDGQDGAALFAFHQTVQAHRLPLGKLPPVVTAVGGGITPVNQQKLQKILGNDTILGIGGAIQGHPGGPTAGARAAMRAVAATAAGQSLIEAAADCRELQKAIAIWGG